MIAAESVELTGLPGDPYVSLTEPERAHLRHMRQHRVERAAMRLRTGHTLPRCGGALVVSSSYRRGRR